MTEEQVKVAGKEGRVISQSRQTHTVTSHLHHQHNSVQGDHGHDGILKGWRNHKVPDAVLESVSVLRHVAGEGFGTNGEVNACPLQKVKLLESVQRP